MLLRARFPVCRVIYVTCIVRNPTVFSGWPVFSSSTCLQRWLSTKWTGCRERGREKKQDLDTHIVPHLWIINHHQRPSSKNLQYQLFPFWTHPSSPKKTRFFQRNREATGGCFGHGGSELSICHGTAISRYGRGPRHKESPWQRGSCAPWRLWVMMLDVLFFIFLVGLNKYNKYIRIRNK